MQETQNKAALNLLAKVMIKSGQATNNQFRKANGIKLLRKLKKQEAKGGDEMVHKVSRPPL